MKYLQLKHSKVILLASLILFGLIFSAILSTTPTLAAEGDEKPQPNADNITGIWRAKLQGEKGAIQTLFGGASTGEPSLLVTIGALIKVILGLLGIILLILMLYGGFLWMTSAGEDEKVEKAKKIITSAVIGILIIVIAYALTWFVMERVTSITTP